jgi:hypothetical protein
LTSGSEIYQFDVPFSKCMRLQIDETGESNSITITNAFLTVQ